MRTISTALALVGAVFTLQAGGPVVCALEILDIQTGERTVVREFDYKIEAPNWMPEGDRLLFNSGGLIWTLPINDPDDVLQVDTGFADACNNDHVISADGRWLAISHHSHEDRSSRIYTLPLSGGTPRLVTAMGHSYLHGWSPDGKWLVYCGNRDGDFDVYAIPADGGVETRLTDAPGLDDGPEYSPCGEYIWFNSVRTGTMQVWRMNADGSGQRQMTFDDNYNAWFPHVSPDGQWVIYLAYHAGDVDPGDHPPGRNVELKLMPARGGEGRTVATLFGGQGTINVNSWSPDSRRVALVSYRE